MTEQAKYSKNEQDPTPLPSLFERTTSLTTDLLNPELTPDDINEADLIERFGLKELRDIDTSNALQVDTLPNGWLKTTTTESQTEGSVSIDKTTIMIDHPSIIDTYSRIIYCRRIEPENHTSEIVTLRTSTITPQKKEITHAAQLDIGRSSFAAKAELTEDNMLGKRRHREQHLIKNR
jgi:hypothetical protein